MKIDWNGWKSALGRRSRPLAHIGVLGVPEQNGIPLDCITGVSAVICRDRGDVVLPIRASCSYPGLFQPVRCGERLLARVLGATHVISLHLPMQGAATLTNMFHVINRCFQILHSRTEITWRQSQAKACAARALLAKAGLRAPRRLRACPTVNGQSPVTG